MSSAKNWQNLDLFVTFVNIKMCKTPDMILYLMGSKTSTKQGHKWVEGPGKEHSFVLVDGNTDWNKVLSLFVYKKNHLDLPSSA